MNTVNKKLKTIRAVEPNAGITSDYAKELRHTVQVLQRAYIQKLTFFIKNNHSDIANDALLDTMYSGIAGFMAELFVKFYKKTQLIAAKLAAKYGKRTAEATGRAQRSAMIKAGIPAGTISRGFHNPPPPPAVPGRSVGSPEAPGRAVMGLQSGSDVTLLNLRGGDVTAQQIVAPPPYDTLKIRAGYVSERAKAALPGMVEENTHLITRLCARSYAAANKAVMTSIEQGLSWDDVEIALHALPEFDAGRARRVAMDQCNKITQGIHRENALALGMNRAVWIHVPGQFESRHSHEDILNGREFDTLEGIWDPEVRRYIQPAELPYCRCISRTVIPEELLND